MKFLNRLLALLGMGLLFVSLPHNEALAQCTTPGPGQTAVELTINSGGFASEVFWEIDSAGTTVHSITSGFYPSNNTIYGPTSFAEHQFCLTTDSTYNFEAWDSFGDGWNGGTYELREACSGVIIANNGGVSPNDNDGTVNALDLEVSESFVVPSVDTADAGVSVINTPLSPLVAGPNSVGVTVINNSSKILTSVTVNWSVGGVLQTPFNYVGSIPACGGDTVNLVLGSATFAAGQTEICAWTSSPNGDVDQNNSNDTTCALVCSGLSGTFTVDAGSAASGSNFQSFNDLITTMNTCGIDGPVTVNVVQGSGPYNEQVIFSAITGASATNTITINGNGESIEFAPGFSDKRVVGFDGAKHITLDNMVIRTTSFTYGYGVHLQNGSDSNTVKNCVIDISTPTSSSSTNTGGIIASGSLTSMTTDGNNANFCVFEDNEIKGNPTSFGLYYGIYLNGQGTGADCEGNVIRGNEITDFYSAGIYLDECDSTTIDGNEISRPNKTSVTTFYGIRLQGKSQRTLANGNEIHNNSGGNTTSTSTAYGIYSSAVDADVNAENIFTNNIIHNFNSNGSIYAIYNSSSNGHFYYHNTINLDDPNANTSNLTRGFYQTTTASNIEFINNIVAISRSGSGTKHCLYFNATGSTIASDFNVLFMNAPSGNNNIGRYSSDFVDLLSWQGANTNAYDQNSVDHNPNFIDPGNGNFTPGTPLVNDIGSNLGVPVDFNDSARSTTPDPGAIEFSPPPYDIGATFIDGLVLPAAAGSYPLYISVENFGANAVDTLTITAEISNGSTTDTLGPLQFTGTVINPGFTVDSFNLGMYNFTGGQYDVDVYTSLPDNNVDDTPQNDTTSLFFCTGMSGAYTINAGLPNGGTNFSSFSDLISLLNCGGVLGPVTVDVAPGSGPYNEQVIFSNVQGASATNTITINGNGETVSFAPASTDKRIVGFDGAKHFTIDSLKVVGTGATYGWGFHFTNQSDSNTINNCEVDLSAITSTTSSNSGGIILSASFTSQSTDGDNADGLTITNNYIHGSASGGPYYGIYVNGQSGNPSANNTWDNNRIEDYYSYGMYFQYVEGNTMQFNDISRPNRTTITTHYGMFFTSTSENNLINGNSIHNTAGGNNSSTSSHYGIYHSSSDATVGNENIVANNQLYDFNGNGIIYALYNSSSNGVYYYHNTVNLDFAGATTTSATRCLYQTTTASNIEIRNNLFSISRGGNGTKHCLYFNSTGSTITSDNNGFFLNTANGNVGRYSSDFADLTAWQTANASAYDQNSVESDPVYKNASIGDLQPKSIPLNNIGAALGVTLDIFGNARDPLNPDPGAIEYTPPANDLQLIGISGIATGGRVGTSTAFSATETLQTAVVNLGTNSQSNFSVNFAMGAQSGNETVPGPLATGDTAFVTFATTIDLTVAGNYTLDVYTSLPGDEDLTNDSASQDIAVIPNDPVTLPLLEDFESADDVVIQDSTIGLPGILAFDYFPETEQRGRLQTGAPAGGNTSGNRAISLDVDPTGTFTKNYLIYTVNMSNYATSDSILLNFNYTDHGDENSDADSVWVRGNDTQPWVGLYDLFANKTFFGLKVVEDLDVSNTLANAGQSYTNSFQIRFGQEDNFGLTTGDGFTFDDVLLRKIEPLDIGVISIDSVGTDCGLTNAETVGVTIQNFGGDSLMAGQVVAVNVVNGSTVLSEGFVLPSSLTSGSTQSFVFSSTLDLSTVGLYDLVAYSLLNGDTGNNVNDTAMLAVVHKPTINTYPYFQDFEDSTGLFWTNEGTNSSWELGTPNKTVIQGAASGSNSWTTGGLGTGFYNAFEDSWIESPCFDFTNGPANPWVSLKIWVESEFSWDGAVLQNSVDGGATWTNIGNLGDPDNWFNDGTIAGNPGGQQTGWTGRNGSGTNGWVIAKHALDTALLNGESQVIFRVAFGADNTVQDDGFAFDDFGIGEPPVVTLGVDTAVCSPFVLTDATLSSLGEFDWSTGSDSSAIVLENLTNTPDTQQIVLTYTDTLGLCTSDTIDIIVNPLPSISLASTSYVGGFNLTCKDAGDGDVTSTPSGGDGSYTYAWTGTGSFSSTMQNLSSLDAGTYSVTLTDGNSCSATSSIVLTEPDSLTTSSVAATFNGGVNVSCNGESDGSVTLSVTGGNAGYSYSWSGPNAFASMDQNPSALAAGTYTVTTTDTNGCQYVESITLTEPAILTSSATAATFTGGDNVSCNGASDGSITLAVTGGTTAYSYSWTGPNAFTSTSQNPTGLEAGDYDVTVTDANGCTSTSSVTLTEPAVLTTSATSPTFNGGVNVSCKGDSDGSISLSVSGGHTTYSYSWTGPNGFTSTDQNPNNLEAGDYDVTVTDANGCTATTSITLTEPTDDLTSALTAGTYAGGVNISCNGLSDGSVTTVTAGGTSPYSSSWTGPNSYSASTADITGVEAGTFTVMITDDNGCTFTDSVTLIEPAVLTAAGTPDTFVGGSNISCNGFSDGGITLAVNGGTTAYTYSWNGPNSFSSTTQNPASLEAGTYSVMVTDANGCTATTSNTLTEPAVLASTSSAATYVGGANVSCIGFSDGSITLSPTGGTMAYSYSWTGPNGYTSTDESPTGLEAGTYSVLITDANGCTSSDGQTLTDPPTQVAIAVSSATFVGGFNISCTGASDGSITSTVVDGVAGYSYSWTGPSSYTSTDANPANLLAGAYQVTVTDTNGCTDTTSISLIEPANSIAATASAITYNGGVNVSCFGASDGEASVSISGGTPNYTYSWTGPNSYSSINAAPTNLGVGTYDVVVTDANGCTAGSSVTLSEPAAAVSSTATAATFNGGVNISCNGAMDGSVTLAVSGGTAGYMYSWTGPASYTSTMQNPGSLDAGAYNVTVTDTNGCTSTSSVTLTEPAAMGASTTASSFIGGLNISCNGASDGSVDLTTTGGTTAYTYSWTGPNSFTSTSEDPSSLEAGFYEVTVTDDNGCTVTDTITLTQPAVPLTGSALSTTFNGGVNVSCFGASDGSITLAVTGGGPIMAYTYNWTGPNSYASTNQNPGGLEAGTYSVTVTDINGCTDTTSIMLSEPADLTGATTSPTFIGGANISCFGLNDGSVDLTAAGGTMPYTYNWNGTGGFSATTEDISGLPAGTFTVMVTDDNGCTTTVTAMLTEPAAPVSITDSALMYMGGMNISCNGAADGAIAAIADGGTPGYAYSWNGPGGFTSSDAAITGLLAGTYQVFASDTNGCVDSSTITLIEPDALVATAVGTNVNCEGGSDGMVAADQAGGIATFTYLWDDPNGQTTATATGLEAGTYNVTVTDVNGCTSTTNATITFDHTNPVIFLGTDTTTEQSDPLTLDAGAGFSSYLWQDGSVGQTFTATESGIYSVVVVDTNGCSGTDTIDVSIWPTGIQDLGAGVSISYFPNPTNGLLNLKASGLAGEMIQLEVMTLSGQVIQTERVSAMGSELIHTFNLQTNAQGIYFIRLTAGAHAAVHRISVK